MRKSILAMFVVMIAMFAVACGGNKPAGNGGGNEAGNTAGGGGGCAPAKADPEAQWKALYKKDAEWVMVMGGAMMQKTKVVSVDGTKAKTKSWTFMGTKDPKWEGDGTDGEAEYKKAEGGEAKPDPKWKELGKGTDKVAGVDCDWVEGEYDGKKMKTWTATKFGLVAKSEMDGKVNMELVEFKEGK